jgi:hypothetical protein
MRSSTLFLIASAVSAFTATVALPRLAHAADKDAQAQPPGGDDDDDDAKKKPAQKKPAEGVEPPAEEWNIYDVEEKPGKTYFFIGANYRGNVVPAFMLHMFVDEGKTIYTNMAGIEFEYGLGVGLGAVFGDLENSWVREQANGELANDKGRRFTRCDAVDQKGTGCNAADHQNSDVNKVNGYKEKNWFDGGSKPVLFPWLSVPQVGLRFKPIKNFVARVGIGFALTGFWFGFSAQYGLEQKPKP